VVQLQVIHPAAQEASWFASLDDAFDCFPH
jgi:hypothetical protein